jgi:hypothetical protein
MFWLWANSVREFDLASFAAFVAEELVDGVEHAREEALEVGARAGRARRLKCPRARTNLDHATEHDPAY